MLEDINHDAKYNDLVYKCERKTSNKCLDWNLHNFDLDERISLKVWSVQPRFRQSFAKKIICESFNATETISFLSP